MEISIFRHFTNSFHGNQLFCNIRNTFEMKTVSHLQVAFEILKLSVLDKNLCVTEVVSTRLPHSLLYQFLDYKSAAYKIYNEGAKNCRFTGAKSRRDDSNNLSIK